ncbi:MAG: FG-GAP repeat protein [Planctomycetota bacterium]
MRSLLALRALLPVAVPAAGFQLLLAWCAFARAGDDWDFSARQQLTASDGVSHDKFGYRVAVDGDVAVVGVPLASDMVGVCYVFHREHGIWTQRQKLMPADTSSRTQFGASVAIDGSVIVVGATDDDDACPHHDDCNTGAAYVFRFAPNLDRWQQEAKLIPSDALANDLFGFAVAAQADAIVVGAPGYGAWVKGAAYAYRRTSSGLWQLEQKIKPSDLEVYDGFGAAIAIDHDALLIGAPQVDFWATGAGHARVFRRAGSSWVQEQKLIVSGSGDDDYVGAAVALQGNRAFVGIPGDDVQGYYTGSVVVFERDSVSGVWIRKQQLLASDGGGGFGASLSAGDHVLAVGARVHANERGETFVFREQQGTWTETQRLIASQPRDFDEFGCSVALSGRQLLIGAYGRDDRADDAGAVSVYVSAPPVSLRPIPKLHPRTFKQRPRVWYVGTPDDDFIDIQSAIDAAQTGDVIFVKPIKTFEVFSLSKGVVIRCISGRFMIKPSPTSDAISIVGIPADEVACVSGIENGPYGPAVSLDIRQCAGHVILEDLALFADNLGSTVVTIDECAFVHATDLLARGGVSGQDLNEPAVHILDSQVIMSSAFLSGPSVAGFQWDTGNGCPGASGLVLSRSRVVMCRSSVRGGSGGDGDTYYSHEHPPTGGRGGAGITLDAADLLLAGCCDERVQGGDGGDAGWDWDYRVGTGGDGGPGVSGMSAVVNHVELLGGPAATAIRMAILVLPTRATSRLPDHPTRCSMRARTFASGGPSM